MKTNTVKYLTNFMNHMLKQFNGEVYITMGEKKIHVSELLTILEDAEHEIAARASVEATRRVIEEVLSNVK